MPHLRNFIAANQGTWLQRLVDEYNISVVHDDQANPRLVSLKYDQINSPMHEPIVQECRGVVVDLTNNSIIAHPYNKFWNLGEHLAHPVEWQTARVQEKLDGSLMLLHWDPAAGQWSVASSGHPTAGGRVGKADQTFAQLFWQTFSELGMALPHWSALDYVSQEPAAGLVRDTTYMFELCTQDNRIVCRHEKPRLVLHGARHVPSEREWPRLDLHTFAQNSNWEIVKEYSISTAEDALKAAEALNPLETEGFVVVDGNFNRVKIKSPRYVALGHLKGNGAVTARRAIKLWITGDVDELLLHFPEIQPEVAPIMDRLNAVAADAWNTYVENAGQPTRKDFALAIKGTPYQAVCFQLLSENTPSKEGALNIMRKLSVEALERMAGYDKA